ncbi:hypothetical protein U8C35_06390 [Sinorhizobium medicae]|uniref:hypothetical protein n=1 Tax=Sinorhizobium medicae TaxID=110321 RepID=UPI002AF6A328|nr:hypothetical protein [Sinorhizobium medicae]WQO60061.1 hypothetical protein U8C35_06390 [Sinorhizobium medicae]
MGRKDEPETVAFCNSFKAILLSSDASSRQIGKEIGCGHATLSRIASGKAPDINTYFKVKRWMAKQGNTLAMLKAMVAKAEQEINESQTSHG